MTTKTLSASCFAQLTCALFLLLLPVAAAAQAVEVLHSFSGCEADCSPEFSDDGAHPRSTLVQGADGYFYGTTFGGDGSLGTIFKIASSGAMTHLFKFYNSNVPSPTFNGAFPVGSLVYASDGAFYGGTDAGGSYGDGTLFRIGTSVGSFTKLHDFDLDGNPSNNGGGPWGGLVQGPLGKFYGTTQFGGSSNYGTVFRRDVDGTVTTLHNFSGSDGQWPQGDLMLASDGNIYGTTWAGGGAGGANCPYNGCGTIFRVLTASGTVEMVHAFDFANGSAPAGGRLVQGADGNLYGTTQIGGNGQISNGTAFKMALDGTFTFTLLHSFLSSEGIGARSSLLQTSGGNFYGMTQGGVVASNTDKGTIFQLTPGGDVTVLHRFVGPDGDRPWATSVPGALAQGSDGHLYGTRVDAGDHNMGVVFRVRLPRAQNGTLTVVEDTATNGTLVANDPNNAPLTFSIVSDGLKGTATITDASTGAFTYIPNANATGADSFTFKANNSTMDTNVATISVTISPVNDAPVAQIGSLTTDEDVAAVGGLVATDVDGPALTYSIVTNGAKGAAAVTNSTTGAFTYTPNTNANGADTFTFKANDGSLDSNEATITVTIAAVNDAPVATNGTATTTAGTPVNGTLSATDLDGNSLTFSIVANAGKGTAAITNSATGAYTYTPNASASGTDTFTFNASDGTVSSNTATVTITITGGNQPPVANNSSLTVKEDRSASSSLAAIDPEGSRVTYAIVSNGTRGVATITNASSGRFTYVPSPNANGADSFTFKASDGTADSNVATVSVTITPVNDVPVAQDASATTQANQPVSGTLQAIDVDGDTLTFGLARAPRRGSVVVSAGGAFTYTPAPGFTGSDAFRFRATDPAGSSSAATISISVTP